MAISHSAMIKSVLKKSLQFLLVAFVVTLFMRTIGSAFLSTFLKDNLVQLQVALLALNVTTIALVLTRIRELIEMAAQRGLKSGATFFAKSVKEIKLSLAEQLSLVAVAILALSINQGTAWPAQDWIALACNTVTLAAFIYTLDVTWDLGKALIGIISASIE
ncbi:hypothetical protein V3390_00200 [Luteimonas sp. FXH3W]|uniref:Uncharacterized protein n=1 Tax=Aquilutibacter rugosus TaxID=3115820 RepID=A0ABU7UXI0_9GAMM